MITLQKRGIMTAELFSLLPSESQTTHTAGTLLTSELRNPIAVGEAQVQV